MPVSSGSDPHPLPPHLSSLCARGALDKSYIPGCTRKSCRLFVVSAGLDCAAERKALHLWLLPDITKVMGESGVEFDLVDPYFCCPDNFCCDALFRELCVWEMEACRRWTTVGLRAIVLLNSKYGSLTAPPFLTKNQFAAITALTQDPPISPPAAPSSRPVALTHAQSARLIRSWYSAPLPESPEVLSLVPTTTRYPLYGTLDLDQKAAMMSWAAAEQELTAAFETCGIPCPSLLHRLLTLALAPSPAPHATKNVPVCSVKRLLRCLTPQDPSAPAYLNVERGGQAVVDDLELRMSRMQASAEAAIHPGMQKQHTVVWSDVGITSSTHSEYLRDVVSDVYTMVVDAVSSSSDARPPAPPILLDVLSQSEVAAAAAALPYIPGPPLQQLLEYLLDHTSSLHPSHSSLHPSQSKSSAPAPSHACAIVGCSGSGRAACVAVALSLVTACTPWSSLHKLEVPQPPDSSPVALSSSVVVYRSVRHTMGLLTPRALLLSVIQQICAAYAAAPPSSDTPFMALVNDLPSYLSMATAARPLIVAIVGMDGLHSVDEFSKVLLVPPQLPPYVKFIVTLKSVEGEMSELHDYMFSPPDMRVPRETIIHVKPLAADAQPQLLRAQLKAAGVAISVQQMIELREALQEVPTPLYGYLITQYSAIRGSAAPVIRFSRSVTAVVDSVFERLSSMGLNDRFIGEVVGLLGACPCGLSEIEICDIVSCNDRILGEFFKQSLPPVRRCPRIAISKFIFCCAPLLQQLQQNGIRVWILRHPDIIQACVNRFHADTGLAPFYCKIAAYFRGELAAKYDDRNLKPQPWVYSPPARATIPNLRKIRLLPMMTLLSGSLELIEDLLCKGDFVPMALAHGPSMMDVVDYFSFAMRLLLHPSVSAASRNAYAARFQARIQEFGAQLAGQVAFDDGCVPLEERLYEWEIELMHVRCQRVERDMLQKWRSDGSSALPFVPKFPDLHALRKRREKYLRNLIPKRWMPASSAPTHRLALQRTRALDKHFTDSKQMHAALMTFVGQRLVQQMTVQAVLLMSRQVAHFTHIPSPDTPIFATKGLELRNAQIISLEIEKLTRIYSVISVVGSGDEVSGSALQAQQFLMNALLRARMFIAQSSRAAKQVIREVEFAEVAIRDPAALACLLVRGIWQCGAVNVKHVAPPTGSDDSQGSAVQQFLSQSIRGHYCNVSSHLSGCLHVVRLMPTRLPGTEEDVNAVCENIAMEFGVGAPVRDFDGFPFAAAVEAVVQKFFPMFSINVLDESATADTILPDDPTLRLRHLPLVHLRSKVNHASSMCRHGLEQTIFMSHGSSKADKSIDSYANIVKGTNLADFVNEMTHMVKSNAATTDKILMDFFRNRGSEDKPYSCDAIPSHKLHSLFSLHVLAIRRARAQILGFKSACCALEASMLERLLLLRRLSTVVSVFVKDNQAFESVDEDSLALHSHVMFTFEVDPLTGVMSVLSGHHAVVFSEALKQLDSVDAALVNVCQISCANQPAVPLSRLHVMHDVWCAQAVFEEARFMLLRSMHELLMRCSSLTAVEQSAKHMNTVLDTQSHWDFNCDEQCYALLSVTLQAQNMIMRSQMIDRSLVAQVVVERSLCSEFASVLGAHADDLDPEVVLQRMCGLRQCADNGGGRSCSLAPGHVHVGDIGSGNAACRVFQLFSVLDDAVDCVCDLRHVTSSCMQFAVAMEASRFALSSIRRVHVAHNLQMLPTLHHASISRCSVPVLELCDNPALVAFVCKTSERNPSFSKEKMGAAFECLRLREYLLDASYRTSVLRSSLTHLLHSCGVSDAIKAEKSGFSTKPRKERDPAVVKAPTIELAATNSAALSLCSNPFCSKLAGLSFESLDGLRALTTEESENQSMQTLRVCINCELSESYVLEALLTHSQLAVDAAWRSIACKEVASKSKTPSSGDITSDVKLPCNWAGGGLRGALPLDSAITTATALYSREKIYFNATATISFETPSNHEQALTVLHSFCAAFASEADLPLLIAQCALQTTRLAMKLARLPPKCSPISAAFVEPRIKSASQSTAQVPDARRSFSSQGDLVDIFILPSIIQWIKPVCNSAAILNHYLCALMTLSDLLSLVHVRGVIVSESSVSDAMVGLFHKIVTEIQDRKTKATVAEIAHLLQLRCHSWFVKHTILLKTARNVMLQNEDYKNARRLLTAASLIEKSNAVSVEEDVTTDDGGSLSVVEHMQSRASLGFLDEEFVLTPFAERSMLGNEYSRIDFETTSHLTSLVKSTDAATISLQEFEYLRMQLSAVDVRDGLVSLKSGRPRPETKEQYQESTEIIENYVRQQLGVQMSNLGPEDFVVKLVSRTNVLLLRNYLLEIGATYDKVSQFEAEIQAASKRQSNDDNTVELQTVCAELLMCLSRESGDGDVSSGTKSVSADQLNRVLGDFALALSKQSVVPSGSKLFMDLTEARANIENILIEQKVEKLALRDIDERFSRLHGCRLLDKACAFLYKEHAYANQLHRLRKVIRSKTSSAEAAVESIFKPVVQELDTQNRTRRAALFRDCKDAMFAYSKTIAACFREAAVVASNCHMPGQRLTRKPPTPFPDHAASQASSQVVYYSERLHPLEYPSLVKLLVAENAQMEDELVCARAFYWWKRMVATSHSVETIHRESAEKDKITKERFGITHRVLATPHMIEEVTMQREASELQYRILKGKCDQALAERDELVSFKVATQKRIEELEERRGVYELKFHSDLDVDAISQRLEALPPLDDAQMGLSSPKSARTTHKRELHTALRQAASTKALIFQQIDAFRDVQIPQASTKAAFQDCERSLEACLDNLRKQNGELDDIIVRHSFADVTRGSPLKSALALSSKSPLLRLSPLSAKR